MSAPANILRLAFFGDDFTGSTDALESLTRAGLRTALFLEPPTPEQLAALDEPLDAIGVAGLTRSLASAEMEAVLRPALTALRELGPRHVHYKVCSTFDSSPTVGSIGRALEIGREVFAQRWVPLLVGAPALGRYVVFGNLFARFGIGSAGAIHRLDRHPAMMAHPVTPMHEADLLQHLAAQTTLPGALLDVLALDGDAEAALEQLLADEALAVVLFDGLTPAHLETAGRLIDEARAKSAGPGPWFSVGSSAVSVALAGQGAAPQWPTPESVAPLLVVSGSCSPVTAGQITWAAENEFKILTVDAAEPDWATVQRRAIEAMQLGRSVVICTSLGPVETVVPAATLGPTLGWVAGEILRETGGRRLLVAGGDTSSYVGRALGIESLRMVAPLAPGAPLCAARGASLPVPSLEVVFKGGQVGAPDFFAAVRRGCL
ncbi:four-carbon acid sugar kinase family protein [Actomonas aquatica]|uniref:Four-carbon acid sugar kinase family protein n=1 Tax=Actomonas aquatica TaxID=2866162 RepID=A0ABZ1C949_9BACT|nr:four-carbon acid sugar kinase family protein [Opitutus sp. WL0086]WRQ88226.1 four-carbon acid sugar kinase family protein [Opitutus sp. WL0086]